MNLDTWIFYTITVLILMSTPGPSHLLMLGTSLNHGLRRSLATAGGDLSANVLQMLAAGLGLAGIIAASATALAAVKWFGVAYLAWLGLSQLLRRRHGPVAGGTAVVSVRKLFMRGFLTSAANPKAVVFFAALFPQFLDANAALAPQLLALGGTYVVIDGCFLVSYGAGASWLSMRLTTRARVWIDRAGGGVLLGAAILLGLRGVPEVGR